MADIVDQWFANVARNGDFSTMQVWDGDGDPDRVFEINFEGGYINKADVKAFMVETLSQYRTDLNVIFINGNTVKLSHAVPAGTHKVTIYRDTPKARPLASFVDGAIINASNLDRNAKQAVFSVAEMVDRFDSVVADSEDALRTAYNALGLSREAINTADAAKAQSALAEQKADAAVSTANIADSKVNGAVDTANDAKSIAEGVDGKAQQALDNSVTATNTANSAKSTAEGIDAKATQALTNSGTATTTANAAKATAEGVDGKAQQALDNAAAAVGTANTAKTTADNVRLDFDKLWGTVDSVSSNIHVSWKGNQTLIKDPASTAASSTSRILQLAADTAYGQVVAYRNTTDGGLKFSVRSDRTATVYDTYMVDDGTLNTGRIVTRLDAGKDPISFPSTFYQSVVLDFHGNKVRLFSNGDIVSVSGSNIFSNIYTGANSLASLVNTTVVEVYLGGEGRQYAGPGTKDVRVPSGCNITGFFTMWNASDGTYLQDVFYRAVWTRFGDGRRVIIGQL